MMVGSSMNQQPSSTTIINNPAPAPYYAGASPPYGAPATGSTVAYLPPGATTAYAYGATFYYSNGTFYQQNGAGYQIVTAPIGANVYTLPYGAYASTINGATYYVSGSTYYKPYFDGSQVAYTVAQV
jgi:Family of unknown function (DUF6515)